MNSSRPVSTDQLDSDHMEAGIELSIPLSGRPSTPANFRLSSWPPTGTTSCSFRVASTPTSVQIHTLWEELYNNQCLISPSHTHTLKSNTIIRIKYCPSNLDWKKQGLPGGEKWYDSRPNVLGVLRVCHFGDKLVHIVDRWQEAVRYEETR